MNGRRWVVGEGKGKRAKGADCEEPTTHFNLRE